MKEKIFAITSLTFIIAAIAFNTVKMHKDIDSIHNAVSEIKTHEGSEIEKRMAESAYMLFKTKELFLGLTVNHDDLSNIEEGFAEIIGYLSVGNTDEATVTKNRLLDSLSHLRRLSGFNIDAII